MWNPIYYFIVTVNSVIVCSSVQYVNPIHGFHSHISQLWLHTDSHSMGVSVQSHIGPPQLISNNEVTCLEKNM